MATNRKERLSFHTTHTSTPTESMSKLVVPGTYEVLCRLTAAARLCSLHPTPSSLLTSACGTLVQNRRCALKLNRSAGVYAIRLHRRQQLSACHVCVKRAQCLHVLLAPRHVTCTQHLPSRCLHHSSANFVSSGFGFIKDAISKHSGKSMCAPWPL